MVVLRITNSAACAGLLAGLRACAWVGFAYVDPLCGPVAWSAEADGACSLGRDIQVIPPPPVPRIDLRTWCYVHTLEDVTFHTAFCPNIKRCSRCSTVIPSLLDTLDVHLRGESALPAHPCASELMASK